MSEQETTWRKLKKCQICGQDIKSDILYQGDYDQINLSIVWPEQNLDLDGHKICLENINELIIKPNRVAYLDSIEKYIKNN